MNTSLFVTPSSQDILEFNINKNRLSDHKLEVAQYRNAVIDPLGEGKALVVETDERYKTLNTKSIKKHNHVAIYLGYFVTSWGHILTDGFKKLWFLKTNFCKDLLRNGATLVYVTTGARPILTANEDIISLLGYSSKEMYHIIDVSLFDILICPDDCFWGSIENAHYTIEYLEQIESIKRKFFNNNFPVFEKLYFTRISLRDKRDYGEKPIENFFRKRGYHIVAPEKLTVEEQIALVYNCSNFASTEGSVAHISIFCKPNTEVIVLRKADYVNCYQLAINQAADLNCV